MGAMSVWRVVGLLALVACKREAPPPRESIVISVSLPTLDAAQIDQQVVSLIEEMVVRIPKVSRVVGKSEDGVGIIRIDGDVSPGQVRAAIDVATLPSGTWPEVLVHQDWPRLGGYTLRSSRLDITQLRAWHDQTVRTSLYTLAGIKDVVVCGGGTGVRMTEIQLDIDRLGAFGLTATDVIEAVRHAATSQRAVFEPDKVDALRNIAISNKRNVPVTLADVATRSTVAPSRGCQAYDDTGAVVSVDIYGVPSERELVTQAIAKIAGPDVEVIKTPELRQLLLAIPPDQVPDVARRLHGGVVRTGASGWLAQDVVLDVPFDRAEALRQQLAAELPVGIVDPGLVAWVFRDGPSLLVPGATEFAARAGVVGPATKSVRELTFDVQMMGRASIALTQEQRSDLHALVNDGVMINEHTVIRLPADVDITRVPVGVGVVPLGQVAAIQAALVPRSIWQIDRRFALPVRLNPSNQRATRDALAHDPNVKIAPLVHLP
jgi:multidrug efflux pump subunit AcrB